MDAAELTEERFDKQAKRKAKEAGWGSTVGAMGIAEKYLSDYSELVAIARPNLKPKSLRDLLACIPDDLMALVGVTQCLSLVSDTTSHLSTCLSKLGTGVDHERYGFEVTSWDETFAHLTAETVKKTHRNVAYRKQAFRSLAQRKGFKWTPMASRELMKVGAWLLDVMLAGPVFMTDDLGNLTITHDALEVANDLITTTLRRHPVSLPVLERPDPWTGLTTLVNGIPRQLVRTHDKAILRVLREALRDGSLDATLEAVNAAQDVSWSINEPIRDLVRHCYDNDIAVPGLPPKADLPKPPHGDWETMTDDSKRAWKMAAGATKGLNRSYLGQRMGLATDLATADWIADRPFWTHCNLDYRGRLYPVPGFNFQKGDYVRAMFRFSKGKALGETGLYWLKVHVANTGGFDKIDKRPFDERVAWVDAHNDLIWETAQCNREELTWTTADKPFMFVAACIELASALSCCIVPEESPEDFVSHLPISFDGSCSGLQHLGAMTRDENTCRLVNLTDNEEPKDVYSVVAELASERIRDDLSGDDATAALAQRCIDYGVNRKLVKRNVMTFSYSSQKFGMAEQHREDTMTPLRYEVMAGRLAEHPFKVEADRFTTKDGKEVTREGHTASVYLAGHVYDAIEETVRLPAEAMRFLQGIAKALAHEGKPVIWHTPTGFPVVLRCPNTKRSRLTLWMHDEGVRHMIMPTVVSEAPGIDKRKAVNAIAPGFVHSLDANHLHCVLLACIDNGIEDVALVHDSFGCHAADSVRFREIVTQEFKQQYANNDVLFDIWREAHDQLDTTWHRLPPLPPKGKFCLNEITGAKYAFA